MSYEQDEVKEELDARAKEGETVVPGGKSLEAQERLAEGRSKGGQMGKEQIKQIADLFVALMLALDIRPNALYIPGPVPGEEGYREMGRKGGLSTKDQSGEERAKEEGIPIDESKFKTKSRD